MSREDLERLLGGYAAGNLTPEELRALAAGALDDQELFDQLAREQVLRETLDDPAARATLLAALGQRRRSWWRAALWVPAAAAVAAIGIFMLYPRKAEPPMQVAEVRKPAVALEPPPPAPAAEPVKPRPKRMPRSAAKAPPAPPVAAAPPPPPPPPAVVAQSAEVESAPARAGGVVGGVIGGVPGGMPLRSMARATVAKQARDTAPATLQVSWTVMRRSVQGGYAPLAAGEHPRPGDMLRLALRPAAAGFLTVWQRDASGGRTVLFQGPVRNGEEYLVPAQGALRYDDPGAKIVYARLSDRELPLSEAGAMGMLLDIR